jgi:hypothetical protein
MAIRRFLSPAVAAGALMLIVAGTAPAQTTAPARPGPVPSAAPARPAPAPAASASRGAPIVPLDRR